MFKNTMALGKKEEIKERRASLAAKKREVQDLLREIRDKYKLTDNHIRKRSLLQAPPEVWELRKKYTDQIKELNDQLTEVNFELREAHIKIDVERNIALMGVFQEIFNAAQRKEIMEEIDRRRNGETPYPLGLDMKEFQRYKDERYRYKQLSKEQMDKMIEFRILLTGIIKEGCEKFGDAEFLKFISPLNKLILPVEELRKIKLKHFL